MSLSILLVRCIELASSLWFINERINDTNCKKERRLLPRVSRHSRFLHQVRPNPHKLFPHRGATTFSKLGVQFLGLGYYTEQNTDGIPSFVHCSLQLRKKLGWSLQILGVRTPPNPTPVVAPLFPHTCGFPANGRGGPACRGSRYFILSGMSVNCKSPLTGDESPKFGGGAR